MTCLLSAVLNQIIISVHIIILHVVLLQACFDEDYALCEEVCKLCPPLMDYKIPISSLESITLILSYMILAELCSWDHDLP